MGKYDPLFDYLQSTHKKELILSYDEIEKIISTHLPSSAYKYKIWWDNNSHIQSNAWQNAGYKVTNIVLGKNITFTKK